jgi:MoCo/4Fe-4S cofactor protein with predicted Tat translocation signal
MSSSIKSRLAGSHGRVYWRSLGELADTLEFREYLHREFPEQASEWNDPKGRRQFLKLMSASLALAGVGACTKQPAEEIVPYVRQPEDLVPGRPLFFASAVPFSGIAHPVLVESHMGHPTKIEGNPEHPASLGATDTFTQAAILGLYDPDRAKAITNHGEITAWGLFLTAMQSAVSQQKARQGAGLRFLSGPITSPSTAEVMASALGALPQAKWHQYDPISSDGAGAASLAEGSGGDPIYHFDKADVIVSLDADFLTCGPGSVRYQKDFAAHRRVTDERKEMSRLYAVESTPTLTGVKADHRLAMKAGEIEGFGRQLAGAVGAPAPGGPGGSATDPASVVGKWLAAIAKDLQAHRGRSLVIPGDYQPAAVHTLARSINQALGNVGTTVTYGAAIEAAPTADYTASLRDLVQAMDAGQVDVLVMLGGLNPVYSAPADLKFAEKLAKVKLAVYHGLYVDETAFLCHWNVPDAHPLESWGDSRSFDGTITLTQPLIAPLYDGRSACEIIATCTSQPDRRSSAILKDYWTRAFAGGPWTIKSPDGQPFKNFDAFWRRSLHDGFISGTALADGGPATPFSAQPVTPGVVPITTAVAGMRAETAGGGAAAAPATPPQATTTPAQPSAAGPQGGLELIFRPDPTVWDGRFSNNGWLQELPKPLTKVTWDGTAWMNPKVARERSLEDGDVIELRYRGNTARMPVVRVPGHPEQSVTVFFGYGRQKAGNVGNATKDAEAFNAFLLRTSDAPWFGNGLEIAKTGERYPLAVTQEHHVMEGRAPVRAATVEEYKKEPKVIEAQGEKPLATLTMYPDYKYEGYKWGMAIDIGSCTGCNACTIACVAENNIPVVGKEQVAAGREMHWIRVDHYFSGDAEANSVETYHQPVPCMQCENAPCELVCPVAATTHSSEGLNDMVYNRCVGTRYCSNNCPYKVRRFNFLLYQDWDTQSLYPMRNPDVSVRSRGVMEKCTYCVQRINQARIDAKRQDRDIRDGEILTACQQVCPSDAIVFGNLNDPNSEVAKLKLQERNYGVLENLNTRPRTTYLAVLRNPNPELEPEGSRSTTEH